MVSPHPALDPRACAEANVGVRSDGRLSGRVVDPHGRPVAGLTVEAGAKPAVDGPYFSPPHAARTAADGTFTLTKIPTWAVRGRIQRAARATIRLAVPSDAYAFVGEPVVADASGKFTFAGLSGYSYGLMVEFRDINPTTGARRFIRTDETVVTAARGSRPLVLILKVPR